MLVSRSPTVFRTPSPWVRNGARRRGFGLSLGLETWEQRPETTALAPRHRPEETAPVLRVEPRWPYWAQRPGRSWTPGGQRACLSGALHPGAQALVKTAHTGAYPASSPLKTLPASAQAQKWP